MIPFVNSILTYFKHLVLFNVKRIEKYNVFVDLCPHFKYNFSISKVIDFFIIFFYVDKFNE